MDDWGSGWYGMDYEYLEMRERGCLMRATVLSRESAAGLGCLRMMIPWIKRYICFADCHESLPLSMYLWLVTADAC